MEGRGLRAKLTDGLITIGAVWLALTAGGIIAGPLHGRPVAAPVLSLLLYFALLAAFARWTGPGRRSVGAYLLAGFLYPIAWVTLLITLIGVLPHSFFDNGGDLILAGFNVGYQFQGGADTPFEAYLPLMWLDIFVPIVAVVGTRAFLRYHRPD
jgi:hypothetical protein